VCGSVRYQVTGEPLSVHACHCTDCQKLSGSAFGLSMVLNRDDLELLEGDIGTAIWFSSPGYAGIIALKPGTLDDTSGLRPIAHMWYRSAQPWLDVGNDLPVYQEQPTFSELLELADKAGRT
jgi:hypothetical protein